MAKFLKARAYCNNEVAYLTWTLDAAIPGCLGFQITRIQVDTGERRILPTWVAFKTQSNPKWEPQDTSVWPVQKWGWRDLTLRRSRDSLDVRKGDFQVQYEIRAVGHNSPAGDRLPIVPTPDLPKYTGDPIPLFDCGLVITTNVVKVTNTFDRVSVAFNNGILSTQNLRKQMDTPDGKAPNKEAVKKRMNTVGDHLREFLAGDILPYLRSLFRSAEESDSQIHLALYELNDPELVDLLLEHADRLHVILCTAGSDKKNTWDITNTDSRAKLLAAIGPRLQNRMFNNSAHIGHNKFGVLVKDEKAWAVWTGSTNWTFTGLCGQTNNTLVVADPAFAKVYLEYWKLLAKDVIPDPVPLSAPNKSDQGIKLRKANQAPATPKVGALDTTVWFSPNTDATKSPKTRTCPADLRMVFDAMQAAKSTILFLVFNPGRTGTDPDGEDVNTAVAQAINLAKFKPELLVLGAISDPTAMPGYKTPPKKTPEEEAEAKKKPHVPQPAIFSPSGAPDVLMIRAAALDDIVGDFQKELLSAGMAIIHDKMIVIDPLSETDCTVITGSHNLGFKASYANDENMVMMRGNRDLAIAYAVHVLDVFEHYKFRAVQEERKREALLAGKKFENVVHRGFLQTADGWQDAYVTGKKGRELKHF